MSATDGHWRPRRDGPDDELTLDLGDLTDAPLDLYRRWLDDAAAADDPQPEAAVLATTTLDGLPSARTVLVKRIVDDGVVFFTNYSSRKGREIASNPVGALCATWHGLHRQVRLVGHLAHIPGDESDAYWASRPPGSRLSAAASPQSEVVPDRKTLEDAVAALAALHPTGDVPRPANWGGYLLTPIEVEVWQGRRDRLHDRFRYFPDGDGWAIERLAP